MKARCLILAATTLLIAAPSAASAAPGDLNGQSCISKTGTGGCAVLPAANALTTPSGVVVAPDGTDVYVGAGAGVAHFRRAPDGSLTYANCVDTGSSVGDYCPAASAPPDAAGALSANSINVAISPDGKHVYAVSWADALLWWSRDATTGDLTWGGCRDGASDSATNGRCGTATTLGGGNFPAGSMAFVQGIAITPDGQTIYIADQTEGLLQAQRNSTTGTATPTACFNTTGSQASGCTGTAASIPMSFGSINTASNNRDVYMGGISPSAITHFTRSGATTSFASCVVGGSPSGACTGGAPYPVFAYGSSSAVTDTHVFTHGGNYATPSGTIGRFARNSDGTLTFESCATTEASPGPCSILPAQTLSGSIGRSTIATPDGASIYTPQTGTTEKVLARLDGSLALRSCWSTTGVPGCTLPPLPDVFASAGQMTLSPDGKQVYQTASDQINTYSVEQPSSGGHVPGSGSAPATPTATKPKIRSVKRAKKGRYRLRVQVFQPGTIRARLTGKLRKRAKVKSLGKPTSKLARSAGTHTLLLKPASKARKRKVRAKLTVTIAPGGYLPASATRTVRLR